LWLAIGALAMGTGIWSMHFTGMLAFKMEMPVAYEISLTLLSVLISRCRLGLALFVVSRDLAGAGTLLIAGPVMGIGIASMHYTGMAAMVMQTTIAYDPFLSALSYCYRHHRFDSHALPLLPPQSARELAHPLVKKEKQSSLWRLRSRACITRAWLPPPGVTHRWRLVRVATTHRSPHEFLRTETSSLRRRTAREPVWCRFPVDL
jgi:hypothetical protein